MYQALVLGSMAGSRATSAPAAVSQLLAEGPKSGLGTVLHWASNPIATKVLTSLTATEFITDKFTTHNRTETPSVIVRSVSGALCGAALYQRQKKNVIVGALAGGLAALAATYALFYLRKGLAEKTGIPDSVLGALEDALVVTGGASLLK